MKEDLKKLPKHIAFIIDGNGRWAKERGLTRSMGHKAGFNTLEKIIKECFYDYNIPIISIYAFSTENWNRPQKEVDYLMNIFRKYVGKTFAKKYPRVRLNMMGDLNRFPEDIAEDARYTMEQTKDNTEFTLNFGANYSGQDELVHAINGMIDAGEKNVTRATIENYLYTKGQPPVDFCVRTSGEYRLSNFMLWQLAYAELYFPETYWPAFNSDDLYKSLKVFEGRDRRFGAIKE